MSLADILVQRGELAVAEQTLLRVQGEISRRWGDDVKPSYRMNQKLGEVYFRGGRLAEARAEFETALSGYRRLLAADHPDVLAVASRLGEVLAMLGDVEAAAALLTEACDGRRRQFGDTSEAARESCEARARLAG